MTGEFEVLGMAAAGYVTSPDGSPLETQNLVTSKLHSFSASIVVRLTRVQIVPLFIASCSLPTSIGFRDDGRHG